MPLDALPPLLCPRCRRLIDRSESRCPYCGMPHPVGFHPLGVLLRWLDRPEDFVRAIVWVNVGLFGLAILFSPDGPHLSANPLTFLSPSSQGLILFGASGVLPIDILGRWWTLITAGYLHGGLLHIFFNMAALRQIAPLIIREYGVYRMFTIYTLGAVAGFYASYLAGIPLTVGASAGLCALVGAALYYGKRRGGIYGRQVYRQTAGWIVGLILIGLLPGINNWAHGGGLIAGGVVSWGLGYQEHRPEGFWHRLCGGALMAVTGLVLVGAAASAVYYRL